jgi:hypothetical protein
MTPGTTDLVSSRPSNVSANTGDRIGRPRSTPTITPVDGAECPYVDEGSSSATSCLHPLIIISGYWIAFAAVWAPALVAVTVIPALWSPGAGKPI